MAIFGETVTLVNRTQELLRVRFDGREQDILPGDNQNFPKVAVIYAKRQNVLRGSEDPENPTMTGSEYLVGVRAASGQVQVDDISPIEQTDEPMTFDRTALPAPQRKGKQIVKPVRVNRFQASLAQPGFEAE